MKHTAERVLARYLAAKTFPTDEALSAYLDKHPTADRKKHKVKRPGGRSGHPVDARKVDKTLDDMLEAVAELREESDGRELRDDREFHSLQQVIERAALDYKDTVKDMRKALLDALPEDARKERKHAQELLDTVDFTNTNLRLVEIIRRISVADLERTIERAKSAWKALHKLLAGQTEMF